MLVLSTFIVALLVARGAQAAGLDQLAKAAGKIYFGSATDNGELSDSAYVAILSNTSEFGQVTPGNTQKWQYTEPSQGSFSFSQGDVVTSFAESNGQILRCHNLVWHQQLPSWVSSGSWTAATLTSVLQAHVSNEVTHWKGQCYAWDVVNEALNDDGTYRADVFFNTLGSSYILIAFEAAAAADPGAKLYYNDYNIEYNGSKSQAALALVDLIKNTGGKIDGVGFQGHFIVGQTPSQSALTSVLNSFVAKGVEVAYTELDIRFSSLPSTAPGLAQQGDDYAAVVGACLAVPQCVGITVWDFDDKYSWVPSTFSGQGDACLYSSDLTPKPAYYSVASVFSKAGATSSTSVPVPTSTSAEPTTSATITLTTVATTTGTTTSAAAGATQTHWGQCGGGGWTGPTACAAQYICQYSNPWYSQCL
ncbi:Beta-xylanase [Pleurostoma richardsiae]|uniref:Beta-xylanase n=1 Tax=Pleurostoma richardsiae TaxID=41990 RepID=A0AA38S7L1_9PEZI|nr:Beta-xylanase [Pleurostoma richardsiae]